MPALGPVVIGFDLERMTAPRSSLVFSPPEIRHGMRDRRKIPASGCKRPHFTINAHIENGGAAGSNGSFKLRAKVCGFLHSYARGTHRSGHHRVVSGEK